MEYLPFPSALPATTKTTHFTPKVVGGEINKGENTVTLHAQWRWELPVGTRFSAALQITV